MGVVRTYRGYAAWDGGVTGSPRAFAPLPPPLEDEDALSLVDDAGDSLVVSCLPYAAALGRLGFDPGIAPGKFSALPYPAPRLLSYALGLPPMTPAQNRALFEAGANDAEAWLATFGRTKDT